uniref:Uncharacterized protein n=1 Tax=Romanomermis culicivorax TaxID=13658 RepID=A0A915KFD0_ROMCU
MKNFTKTDKISEKTLDECRNGRHNNVYYVNDRPTHCVVHSTDFRRGMCVSVDLLYETLLTSFKTRTQRDLDADRTREYKRFLLEHRSQIYTPTSQFDDNFVNHWENGFNTLFMGAAVLFTETHPETHQILKNNTAIGAGTFCDLALRQFPVANNRLYNLLPPTDCPPPSRKCILDTECYVPAKLSDVNVDTDRCISFQAATDMLNNKDDTSPAWHKNEYLA